jgi:Uma2 family endonuclease
LAPDEGSARSLGTRTAATLDGLYRVKGKAELIAGRIVHFMPNDRRPSRVASRITRSLDDYTETTGRGEAYGDDIGFAVAQLISGRQSCSPDASYFLDPFCPIEMQFLEGPPTFAVEVRSEGDYDPDGDSNCDT